MSIDSLSESFGREQRFLIWVFRKKVEESAKLES